MMHGLLGNLKAHADRLRRRFLAPPNSLIICAEQLASDGIDTLERALDQITEYYSFVKLSTMVESLRRLDTSGLCAVIVRDVRNQFMRQWLNRFIEREIPLTFFLRTSCIGLNRLPLDEELRAFQQAYPDSFSLSQCDELIGRIWNDPEAVEKALVEMRSRLGPFPIPSLDPLQFFVTWGRIVEVPPQLRDLGLVVDHHPERLHTLDQQLTIVRQQTGVDVTIARSDGFHGRIGEWAHRYQIIGWVVDEPGVITDQTDRLRLPIWEQPG